MKLKAGSYYLDRKDNIVKIEKMTDSGMFLDKDGFSYHENGSFLPDRHQKSDCDLIKEVRVTIEEVEPVSEFETIKMLFRECGSVMFIASRDEARHELSLKILKEIERLQKLFEEGGDE